MNKQISHCVWSYEFGKINTYNKSFVWKAYFYHYHGSNKRKEDKHNKE